MKKFLLKSLSVFLAFTLLASQNFSVYAGNISASEVFDESVFSYDEDLLAEAMSELEELDSYIETNEGITFSDLENEGSLLIANMESNATPMGMADGDGTEPPLGIPSFLWGCVFGVLGILIVYIVSENDKEEAKKAMWGCLASTVVWVVVYVVYAAAVTTAVTTYY
jgi:hypothetical protein